MTPKHLIRLCTLAASTLLVTCTTLRAYEGPARRLDEVARLTAARMPSSDIRICEIDGRSVGALHSRIEVRPGIHEIVAEVRLRSKRRELRFTHRLRFSTVAGARYVLYGGVDVYGPHTFIVEQSSGRMIAAQAAPPRSGARALAPPTAASPIPSVR